MISLTAVAKEEKNKLSTDSAFLILLDITLQDEIVHICYNTDDITWNGTQYQHFPFEIGDATEDTAGTDPALELKVSNITRALQHSVEESQGGVGYSVILRIVNSKSLDTPDYALEEYYVVKESDVKADWITFILGTDYSSRTRRPSNRYMKNNCPFKYKGLRCGYCGELPNCVHTLTDCRAHNNSERFGGYVGIDQKGVYADG